MGIIRRWNLVVPVGLLVVAVVILGGVPGLDAAVGDLLSVAEPASPDAGAPVAAQSPTTSPSGTLRTDEAGLNETRVERLVHEAVNDYRADAGLDLLAYDPALAEIADYHSDNMAADGRIYHESPSGEDFSDRYEKFGYDCQVSAGGNRYYVGGENVAQTWYDERLTTGERHTTARELAEGIARQWYNSVGHRENMLRSEWRRQGVGIDVELVDGNVAVYATQNFC